MSGVQIKPQLVVGDFLRFCDVLVAVLESTDTDTLKEMQQGEDADYWRIGKELIEKALRVAPDAGEKFLAGLIGAEPAEFREYPATAVIEIVQQFVDHPDASDFFSKARSLFNRAASGESVGETLERAS